jgi:hypothetical protein
MKRPCLSLICFLLLLPASLPTWADPAVPESNWTPANWTEYEARQAAGEVDLVAELKPLFERARAGQDADLRRRLEAVAANQEWPLPARERLLHAFALGLGDLAPGAAGSESLGYLLDYRPQTLVPHEDHASAGVALFNIPAAAAGSMNLWRRQIAYDSSRKMLAQSASTRSASTWNAESWVAAWLAADPASRRGFLDALDLAPEARLREVAALALRDLPQQPELTGVAARSAALLPDAGLLGDALVKGDGPELAAALRSAAAALDESERAGLLRRLVAEAPAGTAALAIAEWAPGLLHDPAIAGLLFDLLGDPALGATAALALAGSTQPAVRERLAERAAHGDDVPARRAAAALAVTRQTEPGEPR